MVLVRTVYYKSNPCLAPARDSQYESEVERTPAKSISSVTDDHTSA